MQKVILRPEFLWFVGIYFVIMLGIGIYVSRKVKSSEDYALAGKSLGPIVLMGTLMATSVGSGTVTGGGNSLAYNYGIWAGICWIIPYIVTFPIYYTINKKIRNTGAYTTSQILGNVYGPAAKMIGFVITVIGFVGIVSYQYRGLAYVLNITTGLDTNLGTILSAIIIIAIAIFGGLFSVAYTDAFGAFLIVICCLVGVPFAIAAGGGWSNITASVDPKLLTFSGGRTWYQWLTGYLPLIILMLGDQNYYQRFAAAKSDATGKIGSLGWLILTCIAIPCVGVIAFVGKAVFGGNIVAGMSFLSTTTLLPTVVGGMLLAAATAFILTTATSYLLSSATNIVFDFYLTYVNKDASDKQKLVLTRTFIPILGIVAYIMLKFFPSILAIQSWSYTMIGAGLTSAILGALLWPNLVTKAAGLTSMILGVGTTMVWEIMGNPGGVGSALVAFPVALLSLIIVAVLTKKNAGTIAAKAE